MFDASHLPWANGQAAASAPSARVVMAGHRTDVRRDTSLIACAAANESASIPLDQWGNSNLTPASSLAA
jgi:hypothetical protein